MAFSHLRNSIVALSLTLLSVIVFSLSSLRSYPSHQIPHRSLLSNQNQTFPPLSCSSLPPSSNGLISYLSLHFCTFKGNTSISIPSLLFFILLHFYILIKTAQSHFSIVTTKLSRLLNLSPSMGGVTLLALGNGSPDVFASLAAARSGQYRTGFGAILSAGTFVSSFVVGFVAIYAAPFNVDPASFLRDVGFYLLATLFLFYVYLSGEIFFWQAVGFVGFYVFFVAFVFWMDLGSSGAVGRVKGGLASQTGEKDDVAVDCERGSGEGLVSVGKSLEGEEELWGWIGRAYGKISQVWDFPVSFLLRITIPQSEPAEWNRFYVSANVALCPVALLYACNSFMPLDHPIVFLIPNIHFPLWLVVLLASTPLALLHFILEKDPPKTEQISVVLVAFLMSVFWISTIAGELLNCLEALGILLEVPPSLLGLTVLAWGNSVGDLVADVAVARAGQPAMAMAGCFAGPMFNMLVGLGTALAILTADTYPKAYKLQFHIGIVIAFVFLLLGLMGSFLVITWSRFRVPRFWGFFLVGLYIFFMAVSILIALLPG